MRFFFFPFYRNLTVILTAKKKIYTDDMIRNYFHQMKTIRCETQCGRASNKGTWPHCPSFTLFADNSLNCRISNESTNRPKRKQFPTGQPLINYWVTANISSCQAYQGQGQADIKHQCATWQPLPKHNQRPIIFK